MKHKNRPLFIGGALLLIAGVVGAITLHDPKYNFIGFAGIAFMLIASRTRKI
jgi:hypothetical protein